MRNLKGGVKAILFECIFVLRVRIYIENKSVFSFCGILITFNLITSNRPINILIQHSTDSCP